MAQPSWIVEFLDNKVEAQLDALPRDLRTSFERIVGLIKSHGLEKIREPYVKHLQGPVWEMRLKGKSGIARACYVTAVGKRVIVIHIFQKKTEKTPRHELVTALKRASEVQSCVSTFQLRKHSNGGEKTLNTSPHTMPSKKSSLSPTR